MSTYKIRSGDTLSGIASRYHTSVSALAKANHLSNPNLIYAGHTLQIPGDHFEHSKSHGGSKGGGHSTHPSGGSSTRKTGNTGGPVKVSASMRRLAAAGHAAAMGMGGYHSQGLCATGVSRAIQKTFGIKVWGNGNQIDNNLPRSKFREVHMSLAQALKTPGLILTWEHTSTAAGRLYGHTAITTGDGHSSCSDFIERDTLAGARSRTGLKIFMPIA